MLQHSLICVILCYFLCYSLWPPAMERNYLSFIIPPCAARELVCTTTATFELQGILPLRRWFGFTYMALHFWHCTSSALKGHMDSRRSMYGLPWLPIEVDEERVSRPPFCGVLSSTDICRAGEEGRLSLQSINEWTWITQILCNLRCTIRAARPE